jgi:hypothetical protein
MTSAFHQYATSNQSMTSRNNLYGIDIRQISSYSDLMRRKAGTLVPLEISILEAGMELSLRGQPYFHGFLIASEIKEREDARLLTAHGTLYKALDRLAKAGLLASEWEDPVVAAGQNRPRRRFYRVTLAGETALTNARSPAPQGATPRPTMGPATP